MSELTAVIVAAGRGIRMGARGRLMPKGMIHMGGCSLVQRSVALLQARGVGRVRIVTGHLHGQFDADFAGQTGVERVHNPDFTTSGSLQSLIVGLRGISGPVVVLESDLIYEAAALAPLRADRSCILVSAPTGAGDEVYVWTRGARDGSGAVFETMSKDPGFVEGAPTGELVGISLFDRDDVEALRSVAVETQARNRLADYEDAVIALAAKRDLACHRFDKLAWSEMDDESMYLRARDTVWPEICRRGG